MIWQLFYGKSKKPVISVISDEKYPQMWRIRHPDGQLSDMVNLSRAKDAAGMHAERGPPARDRNMFNWKPSKLLTEAA